jgi:WD40 repeat protein
MRVYVSSTKIDFEPERRAVIDWLVEMGHQPVHSYVANSESVRDSCLEDVDSCDLYILLLGYRYGFRPEKDNSERLSITQLEYRRARTKPRIALLRTSIPDATLSSVENPEDLTAVLAFRAEVSRDVTPAQFKDAAGLIGALSAGLEKAIRTRRDEGASTRPAPGDGWQWPVPWDFSAFLTSKRALFTGRDWLFGEIEAWLHQPAPRDLLLRADFGVGKSAFVAELVARDGAKESVERRIAALHVCQHDTRETLRASTFVKGLAAQLAQNLPGYRARVESNAMARQQLDRAEEDPGSAFEAAILNPLAGVHHQGAHLIIIDALDESLDLEETETRGGTLVKLLAEKVPRFPSWVRFLVTTRNNPAVVERIRFGFAPKELDGEARLNLDDIRTYVHRRCSIEPLVSALRTAGVDADIVASRLCEKSRGKFLYVVRALDDVTNGWRSVGDLDLLPSGMEAFYVDAFQRRFEGAARDYGTARRLLGVIAAARQPMTPELIGEVLGVDVSSLKAQRAASLTDFIRVRDGEWTFDHASLREWLTSPDDSGTPRAGTFAVDLNASRAALADWASARFEAHGSSAPLHIFRYLPAYLSDSGRTTALKALLGNVLWLEAKLTHLGPHAVLADFRFGPGDAPALGLVARALDSCVHILSTDPRQVRGQLLGRLEPGMAPSLAPLLDTWRRSPSAGSRAGATEDAWLEPLTPSLPPPGDLIRVLAGHSDIIQTCAFSPDGQSLLSASADGTARLWTINGETIAILDAGAGPINYATFSRRGDSVITTYESNSARIWNRAGGLVRVLEATSPVLWAEFSPDDQLVAVTCRDREAQIWRGNGELLATLKGHTRRVVFVTFSPDGQTIATTSRDGTARLWRTDGLCIAELAGHRDLVPRARFSPDGSRVLTVSSDGTATLWDLEGRSLLQLDGHTGPINDAAFNDDGSLIVTGSNDNTARLWRPTGEPVAVLKGHAGWVNHVSFSPGGPLVVTASSDNTARLWQTTGQLVAVLRGHSSWVVDAEFSPDPGFIVTCANDGTLRVWTYNASRMAPRTVHSDLITSVAFSADGNTVLTTSNDRTAVVWDRTGRAVHTLRGHTEWVTSGQVLRDGRIITAAADATARLWRPPDDDGITFEGHAASLNHVTVSPDGRLIATASNDCTARIWRTSGELRATLDGHLDSVNHVAFSGDGELVVTSSSDTTAMVWRSDGNRVSTLSGHSGWVTGAWFGPDGTVVSCSEDGTARVWTMRNDSPTILSGHGDAVVDARFSPDGKTVITASRDGRARLWRTNGDPVGVLDSRREPLTRAIFADDRTVITCGRDGTVRVLRDGATVASLNVDAPVEAMEFNRGLIVCGDVLGGVHFLLVHPPTA